MTGLQLLGVLPQNQFYFAYFKMNKFPNFRGNFLTSVKTSASTSVCFSLCPQEFAFCKVLFCHGILSSVRKCLTEAVPMIIPKRRSKREYEAIEREKEKYYKEHSILANKITPLWILEQLNCWIIYRYMYVWALCFQSHITKERKSFFIFGGGEGGGEGGKWITLKISHF